MISQKTKKMYLIIGIILLILILGIWWWRITDVKEGYNNPEDKEELSRKTMELAQLKMKGNKTFVDEMNIEIYEKTLRLEEDAVQVADEIEGVMDYAGDGVDDVFSAIESEVIIVDKKKKMPQWRDVYGAGDKPTHVMEVKYRPDTSKIINDTCSTKGFLTSEYKEDICTKYEGDYGKINEKCNRLSNENCKIPSCCVLLNDSKCVAGNLYGPTYLTEEGKTLDYKYYHYKGECYGKCDIGNNSLSECAKYANNSTGVSKECMIQMFNNMGCPNKNPEELINDNMVRDFSRSSRLYITNYLEGSVKYINEHSDQDESRIVCYGPTKKCDRFKYYDINVSKDCIEEMLTESGCPRTSISEHEENMYRKYTKENIRYDTNICHIEGGNGNNYLPPPTDDIYLPGTAGTAAAAGTAGAPGTPGTPGTAAAAGTPGTAGAPGTPGTAAAAGTPTAQESYNAVNNSIDQEVTIIMNKITNITNIMLTTNQVVITRNDVDIIKSSYNRMNNYIKNYMNNNNVSLTDKRNLQMNYNEIKPAINHVNSIIQDMDDSYNIEIPKNLLNDVIVDINLNAYNT